MCPPVVGPFIPSYIAWHTAILNLAFPSCRTSCNPKKVFPPALVWYNWWVQLDCKNTGLCFKADLSWYTTICKAVLLTPSWWAIMLDSVRRNWHDCTIPESSCTWVDISIRFKLRRGPGIGCCYHMIGKRRGASHNYKELQKLLSYNSFVVV